MTVFERRLLLASARLLLQIAQRQSVTLGQIKRLEDALKRGEGLRGAP
jgi:hypothetical protein